MQREYMKDQIRARGITLGQGKKATPLTATNEQAQSDSEDAGSGLEADLADEDDDNKSDPDDLKDMEASGDETDAEDADSREFLDLKRSVLGNILDNRSHSRMCAIQAKYEYIGLQNNPKQRTVDFSESAFISPAEEKGLRHCFVVDQLEGTHVVYKTRRKHMDDVGAADYAKLLKDVPAHHFRVLNANEVTEQEKLVAGLEQGEDGDDELDDEQLLAKKRKDRIWSGGQPRLPFLPNVSRAGDPTRPLKLRKEKKTWLKDIGVPDEYVPWFDVDTDEELEKQRRELAERKRAKKLARRAALEDKDDDGAVPVGAGDGAEPREAGDGAEKHE